MEQQFTSTKSNLPPDFYQIPWGAELGRLAHTHPPTIAAQSPQNSPPTHLHPPTSTHLPTLLKALLAATLAGGAITFFDWSLDDWKPTLAGGVGGVTALAVVAIDNRNGRIDRKARDEFLEAEINRIAQNATPEELVGLAQLKQRIEEYVRP